MGVRQGVAVVEVVEVGRGSELGKGHARPSMCTYTGEEFFPLDPEPGKVWLADVAHHLALTCRYRGATRQFHSVAQHSVQVSDFAVELAGTFEHNECPVREIALWGLLHDAAEAYLCDLVSPLKSSLPGFVEAEDRLEQVIAERFGLSLPIPRAVRVADREVFVAELRHGVVDRPGWWAAPPSHYPAPSPLPSLGPLVAEALFLDRARALLGDGYAALLRRA